MWLLHPDLQSVVLNHWNAPHPTLPPMELLSHKLRTLRPILRRRNIEVFGHLETNVLDAINTLVAVQADIEENGLTDVLNQREMLANENLDLQMLRKEVYFKEKSQVIRLSAGDRNTNFFHRATSIKKTNAGIQNLMINGILSSSGDETENHVFNFYTNLFHFDGINPLPLDCVREVIPTMVNSEDNDSLTCSPLDEEIKLSTFSMDRESAPGPDGFNGSFYHAFWDIIGYDVCRMVKFFFETGFVLPGLNSNVMVLLPKVEGAIEVEQFRPIGMSNFSFKIISKILADRLVIIAAKIVPNNQFGFIKGRSIHHCIAVASEGVNLLNKRCFGGSMCLKLTFRKHLTLWTGTFF
ncbi:hypothetical protein M5689_003468 [Euphorbia peplus]|nr:hypothetical protein M5689_003468 [Euphorbia peplus]